MALSAGAADVTPSMVNLGNAPNLAGASNKPSLLDQIITYNNRLYLGGRTTGGTQSIIYYDPADSKYKIERNADGSQLVAWAEKITGLQNADYDLLIAGDDGSPNDKTGLHINDVNGWRFRTTPYDNVHGHTQYKFDGKFFATFGHNPNYGGSPDKGPGIVVSRDNLTSWQIVGDPGGEFSAIKGRTSRYFHEIRGQLFSSGYYASPGVFITTGWLTHHTGDATDSFETVYSTAGDFNSSLGGEGFHGIKETLDLGGNKGILLSATRQAIRFSLENTAGRNGFYLKPIAETEATSNVYDLLKRNGIGYMLERSGSTAKVRWSQDLITWNTLFTCSLSSASAMEIIGGDIYILSGLNLYRIPGNAFDGLPSGNNLAPVANNDSFSTPEGVALVIPAGSKGVLPNDTDGNDDKLTASLLAAPTHGTVVIEGNGRFTYTPAAGYQGIDTFTYSATDGKATSTAMVSITMLSLPATYSDWKTGINWGPIPDDQRGPTNDPDGDGIDNATERAFGTNPAGQGVGPSGKLLINPHPDGSLILKTTYYKGAPERTYILQRSTTLGSWVEETRGAELYDSSSGLHYRNWTAPASQPRAFTRIKVSP